MDAGVASRRRFLSVSIKLGLATTTLVAVVSVLAYIGLDRLAFGWMIGAKEQAARMAAELFLRAMSTPMLFDDPTGIRDTMALLVKDPEVLGVELWRAQGGQPSGPRLAALFKDADTPGVSPGTGASLGTIERRLDRLVLRDVVRDQDGKVLGVAAVQYSLSRENRAFVGLRRRILLASLSAAVTLLFLLWRVTRRWITGPLSRLLRAVKQVEAGERIELTGAQQNDEVGRLAEAFARMAEAVERREHDIVRRNRDMKRIMDNVAQGFLSVTRDGALLSEHSAILERWFGPWQTGAALWDYLRPQAPRASSLLHALWGNVTEDLFPLEVALGQIPARIEAGERTYGLKLQAIYGDDAEPQILVVISDVTLEVEQEQAKVEQQELVNLFQGLVNDRAGLLEFFVDGDRLVHSITAQDAGRPVDPVRLRREVHTLKGNSGFFGLMTVVAVCQSIEDHLQEEEVLSAADRALLRLAWERVHARRRQLLGDDLQQRIEIEQEEHQALLAALEDGTSRAELVARVRSLALEPAQQRLRRLGEQARTLARRLNKGEIAVRIESNGLRLPEHGLGEFWGSFAHLLRNAVDHGLETPEERARAGKAPVGTLLLRTRVRSGQFQVAIEDDGRGINWDKLRERAQAAGLPADTREDLIEALFADGISTRAEVSETSGRGVGMSAVRSACVRTGGTIQVYSEPGVGTRFQFSWPANVLVGRTG